MVEKLGVAIVLANTSHFAEKPTTKTGSIEVGDLPPFQEDCNPHNPSLK